MNNVSEKEGNISVIFGVVSGTLGLALTVEVTTMDEGTKGLDNIMYFMIINSILQETLLVCL